MLFSDETLFFFFSGGIINGTILSLLLLFGEPRRLSNRILGSLILLFSIELFCVTFFEKSITIYISTVGQLILIAVVNFMFLYGVLFYFYVKSLVFEVKKLPVKTLYHLIPFFLLIAAGIMQYMWNESGQFPAFLFTIFGLIVLSQGIIGAVYLFLSLKLLYHYRTQSRDRYSNPEKINLNWLLNITVMQILLWGLTLANGISVLVSDPLEISNRLLDELFYLSMTAIILFAGYFALRHPETFNLHIPMEPDDPASTGDESVERIGANDPGNDAATRDNLMQGQYTYLLELMDKEKPYLNPDLTIDELAGMANIPVYLLSKIVNEKSGLNFFNFINGYRVEEVKKRLRSPDQKGPGILSIALDCGFSSKTTFNTIFKKSTGQTPSQYRKQ